MLELREEDEEKVLIVVESCPINYFQDLFHQTLAVIYMVYYYYVFLCAIDRNTYLCAVPVINRTPLA